MFTRTWFLSQFKTNFLSREGRVSFVFMIVLLVEAGWLFYRVSLTNFEVALFLFLKGIENLFFYPSSYDGLAIMLHIPKVISRITHYTPLFIIEIFCCIYFLYSALIPVFFLYRNVSRFCRIVTTWYVVAFFSVVGVPLIWYGCAILFRWRS